MARISQIAVALSGLLVVPLLDAATKGVFVLFVAGLICFFLRRDSAAIRHCVLSVAVCMLLLLPFLSFLLPQWQMLPDWMVPAASLVNSSELENLTQGQLIDPGTGGMLRTQVDGEDAANFLNIDRSRTRPEVFPSVDFATVEEPTEPAEVIHSQGSDRQVVESGARGDGKQVANRIRHLPAIWAAGVSVLLLRLSLSAWRLRISERRCADGNVILGDELKRALNTVGLKRSVRLLLDPEQTVPIVWGLFQARLRLPSEAVNWPKDQLQSVLLHELAHLKRHDLLELALTQFACSLHWFNPLVWLTAWRLHVERERACDDLVLASGVRPSAYAEHLLQVAMNLAGPRWTQACGLAMARKSSLEGRLLAVLSQKLNRRGTTSALMFVAILGGAVITTPVAMLAALRTPEAMPTPNQEAAAEEMPLHESVQELLSLWQKRARTDGRIPGALIGQLGNKVEDFIRQYPEDPGTGKLIELRGRFDAKRDWTVEELRTLLQAVAAIAPAPLGWTSLPMEFDDFRTIKPGSPLPVELSSAAWGPPAANGLRAAWLLEPQSEQYALNTVLKVRVLFHNAGDDPIIFCTETWHQSDRLSVRNQKNEDIKTSSTFYTGITPLANFRLLPGEYCEVGAPGVAIGAGEYRDEYSTGKLGTVIQVKEGDEVSFSCTVDAAEGIRFSRPDDPEDPVEQWKLRTAERIASEAPLPASPADREQLIRRVMLDLTGESPTSEEVAEFVNNRSPNALTDLTIRIQNKSATLPWTGKLTTAQRSFASSPRIQMRPRHRERQILQVRTFLMTEQCCWCGRRQRQPFAKTKPVLYSCPPIPVWRLHIRSIRSHFRTVSTHMA